MDLLGPTHPDQRSPTPIDPTPERIRDRQGSFPRTDRGYTPEAVDAFLRSAAESLEQVTAANRELTELVNEQATRVSMHEKRAWAVQEAMVAAQSLRSSTQEEAEKAADQIRALAAQEADALLSAARAERDRIVAEAEDLTRRSKEVRAEIDGPLAERRRQAVAQAEKILEEAQAEATAQAMRIRDHAKAEVEVLRQEALDEEAKLREVATRAAQEISSRAEADAAQLRADAKQAVKQIEDENLLHLERRSLQLMVQIEERHAALERLEERRLGFLDRLGGVLTRELRSVERERAQSPLGPDLARDVGSERLIVDPQEAEPVSAHVPDDGQVPRGIIMPDNSVVILPYPGEGRIGPHAITDAPGPLDPGNEPPDDDPPLAAGDTDRDLPGPGANEIRPTRDA